MWVSVHWHNLCIQGTAVQQIVIFKKTAQSVSFFKQNLKNKTCLITACINVPAKTNKKVIVCLESCRRRRPMIRLKIWIFFNFKHAYLLCFTAKMQFGL